ncbi:MAG: hypothetical protein JSW28_07230, partial [Thermoplasmata archaeon]
SETKDAIQNTVCAKELRVVETVDLEQKPVSVKPNYAKLGPKFKSQAREIGDKLKSADAIEVSRAIGDGYGLTLDSGDTVMITSDFVEIEKAVSAHGKDMDTLLVDNITVLVGK